MNIINKLVTLFILSLVSIQASALEFPVVPHDLWGLYAQEGQCGAAEGKVNITMRGVNFISQDGDIIFFGNKTITLSKGAEWFASKALSKDNTKAIFMAIPEGNNNITMLMSGNVRAFFKRDMARFVKCNN